MIVCQDTLYTKYACHISILLLFGCLELVIKVYIIEFVNKMIIIFKMNYFHIFIFNLPLAVVNALSLQ